MRGRVNMLQIDDTDLKILAELVDNSKASFVEIGQKLSLHPNVVAYRVRRLEQVGIIKRYTTILDLEKLGWTEQAYIGASFPEYFLNIEKDETLKQIARIPQIIRVVSLLGDPSLIIFLAGKNKAEIDEVLSKIKSLNIKIESTTSVIKTYHDWIFGELFKELAKEIEAKRER